MTVEALAQEGHEAWVSRKQNTKTNILREKVATT